MSANLARVERLKAIRKVILDRLKPGDKIVRTDARPEGDTFLGLFEYESPGKFSQYGWYATFEFTEARGHRTKTNVEMGTVLGYLGIDWETLQPK